MLHKQCIFNYINVWFGSLLELNAPAYQCVFVIKHSPVLFAGGYAFVYVAQDVKTGTEYALKRLIAADQQACRAINNEISVHKQLSGHGNIVTCIGSSCIAPTSQQGAQFLLLTELCKGK